MNESLISRYYGPRRRWVQIFAVTLLLIFGLACVCQGMESENTAKNSSSLQEIQVAIDSFSPKKPADRFALISLQEALAAAREGNFGYGACLVNESTGEVVERGHNRVFYPYFRSDLHAEMDLLNKYEDRMKAPVSRADGLVMYLSGEPSPMGLVRIISAGITKMYYLVPEPESGMTQNMDCLPSIWRELVKGRDYGLADCSSELGNLSRKIIDYSNEELILRLESA